MSVLASKRGRRTYKSTVLKLLPDQGQWTEEDYLWLTDHTNQLVEFSDGYLEPLPMPTDKHQSVLEFLFIAFYSFLAPRGGKAHVAGLRLRLRSGRFREPDVLALLDASDARRQNRFWTGADLALEVVSEDNPERDLVQKKREYAQARVPEYWIANPENETILVYRLEGKRYVQHGRFRRGQQATSVLLKGFSVEVNEVFDA